VQRAITGFERDERDDWVAVLACGHRQHVRHRPPWQERPWVLTEAGRTGRLGTPLDCVRCDEERGGEAACWAHEVCAACGSVHGEAHRPGCTATASGSAPDGRPHGRVAPTKSRDPKAAPTRTGNGSTRTSAPV
jgi:hypothetical protein